MHTSNTYVCECICIKINIYHLIDTLTQEKTGAYICKSKAFYQQQVQAADTLFRLVSEAKQTASFSGYVATLDDHVEQRVELEPSGMLGRIVAEAAASHAELELHYYSCALRTSQSLVLVKELLMY